MSRIKDIPNGSTARISMDPPTPMEGLPGSASWAILAPSATSNWKGLSSIRYLFIFGDSYSSTSIPLSMKSPEPTDEEPLGVPFPGITTCEPGAPNWVGYFVTEYALNPVLVYNYATPGATLTDVMLQVERSFLINDNLTAQGVPWTGENSLFVTWVGINDVAMPPETEGLTEQLFKTQQELYDAGARNFLFVNLPPLERSPACTSLEMFGVEADDREASLHRAAERFTKWNRTLVAAARRFASTDPAPLTPKYSPELFKDPEVCPPLATARRQSLPGISVFHFSAYESLSAILDEPIEHGFTEEDLKKLKGQIWVDHIHPSTRVHDFLARDLSKFLSKIRGNQVNGA